MKYLSAEAFERLEALKKESFLIECTQKLEEIQIEGGFPAKRKDYYSFVKHIYGVAQMYRIKNRETIFALILAWHIKGNTIVEDKEFVSVLKSSKLNSAQKTHFFHSYIKKLLKARSKD